MADSKETRPVLDLQGTVCPLNWVKTKLELERLEPGQEIEVIIDDGEGVRSVPRSVKAEGHQILSVKPEGRTFRLVIRRG